MNIKSFIAKGRAALMLVLGMAVIASTGCSEEDPPAISLSVNEIKAPLDGGSFPVTVYSNHSAWEATSDAGWARPTVTTDGRGTQDIYVNVDPHTGSTTERVAIITFRTKGGNPDMTQLRVIQNPEGAFLDITPKTLTIGGDAQDVSFIVKSNDSWTALVHATAGDAPMFNGAHTGTGDGDITISVPEFTGHGERQITIDVSAGAGVNHVETQAVITQKGTSDAHITLGKAKLYFNATGTTAELTKEVTIATNITAQLTAAAEQDDWCTPTVETDNSKITIVVTPNTKAETRETVVTIQGTLNGENTPIQTTLLVIQAGADIPLVPFPAADKMNIGAVPTNDRVSIIDWVANGWTVTASSVDGWLNPRFYGTGQYGPNVWFDADDNPSADPRTGHVVIIATYPGQPSQSYTVEVIQAGLGSPDTIFPLSYSYTFHASDITAASIKMSSHWNSTDYTVTVEDDAPWLTSAFDDSAGSITLTPPTTAYAGLAVRTAKVTVSVNDGMNPIYQYTVEVVQLPAEAPVVNYEGLILVPSTGVTGEQVSFVNTNPAVTGITWAVKSSPAFVLNPNITTAGVLTFNVAQNPSFDVQAGDIIVTATVGGNVVGQYAVRVEQNGKNQDSQSMLAIPQTPVLGWEATATSQSFQFTNYQSTATVEVIGFDANIFYAASVNAANNAITYTTKTNATGATRSGYVYLKATKNGVEEYYKVEFSQETLTAARLMSLFTFTAGTNTSSVSSGSTTTGSITAYGASGASALWRYVNISFSGVSGYSLVTNGSSLNSGSNTLINNSGLTTTYMAAYYVGGSVTGSASATYTYYIGNVYVTFTVNWSIS